jgi:DNA-binding LacI/PurR family transcriptional regulator
VTSGFGGEYGILDDPRKATLAYIESQRMLGWLDALDAANVRPTVVRIPHRDPQDVGYEAGETLLALPERPSAVLAFSDAMARGVIRAVEDKGLEVPGDISVVGFDDIQIAAFHNPRLTTVRQPLREMGRIAARLVLERINDPEKSDDSFVVVEPVLIVRDSTGPARARKSRARA